MGEVSPMQKHSQVDVVSLTADGTAVVLSLVETRPWDSNGESLLDLQEKINTYLDLVESGQLVGKYPEAKGKKVVFRLQTAFHPSAQAQEFIDLVKKNYLTPMAIEFEESALK